MSDPYQPRSSDPDVTNAPLYSIQGIVIGTILGSLAAGIVMLYLNYQALGRANLAKVIGIWGAVLFFVIIGIASFAPNNGVYAAVFMVVQAGIAYFLTDRLQGGALRYHQAHAGTMHSNLRAAGVGLLTGMVMFFVLISASVLLALVTGGAGPS